MDIFVETIVKRKLTAQDKKKVMALFITIVLSAVLFILVIPFFCLTSGLAYISTISMIVFAVIVFLIWKALKAMLIEFEYIITNDSLDVDKIIDKKKRSRMISIDIKTVEDIGIYNPAAFVGRSFNYEVHAERDVNGAANYYIIVPHPKYKRTLIVFSPDDRLLEALTKNLPRQLVKNISK
ncbi:MAG: hypothetical protein E7539_07760 [Ruminococcaceae bacterium]|nr:hypothetical protein [Oscillospiraceae bacterium]